jgi:hypothetical protein
LLLLLGVSLALPLLLLLLVVARQVLHQQQLQLWSCQGLTVIQ